MPVRGGVPQCTSTGHIAFRIMINDLLGDHSKAKFVDDTTVREICHVTGTDSKMQDIVEAAEV